MPDLTFSDIERIRKDVLSQEICFSHLADELVDHLCCDVENEMAGGLCFRDAWLKVKSSMGHRRLREIQEETLYAVDTKYRNMKNTMKISAIAGTIMLGFAALFKIMHWPGAGIMLTLGSLLLAFVFMPSALTVLWKETHSGKKLFLYISAFITAMLFIVGVTAKVQHWPMAGLILALGSLSGVFAFVPALLAAKLKDQENKPKKLVYILGAAGLICCILGLLFKIQHWPMASILLTAGSVIIFFAVFPWYAWLTWRKESNVTARFIFMVTGMIVLMLPLLMLNLSLQRTFEAGYYIHHGEQQALFDYRFRSNQSFISHCNDSTALPMLKDLNTRTSELLSVINNIEARLIAEAELKPGVPAVLTNQIAETETGPVINYKALNNSFQTFSFSRFLTEDSGLRNDLAAALKKYSDYLSGQLPGDKFEICRKLVEPAVYLPEINPETERVTLISGLHMLELMKNGILTAESYAIATLSEVNNQ
ncbi:MAG: GldL-related protein [Actinomycetota bacterium]